jgi:thymidylate synthase
MNYKQIIENVLNNGTPKQATRLDNDGNVVPVENGTIGTFCEIFRHDMSEGFPLTTLRRAPWKSTRIELEGFIQGITDKKWYQERGCGFWNEWANPVLVDKHQIVQDFSYDQAQPLADLDNEYRARIKNAQVVIDDLGPVYGYQWRNFAQQYDPIPTHECHEYDCVTYCNCDGIEEGYDQLKSIVDKLKSNPYDRRMICSAWNPNQMHMMALPPCHLLWGVTVYGDKLNLVWHQRSCDLMLGIPANIASYALLLLLLCEESGLKPGELVGNLQDCHIYDNLRPATEELVKREEKELPEVKIVSSPNFSIFDWTHEDVITNGYYPHPALDMGKVTV